MTVQVEYEPVNPMVNKQPFEQYLSAALTRIFQHNGSVSATENPYIDFLRILTNRIREFNAKFILDKSGFRLSRVLKFTLKMVNFASLQGRGWQSLSEFLSKKKSIINIHNESERCFGYALFYFLETENIPQQKSNQAKEYKEDMFQRHHLDTLPYPISPNGVYLYEDQLQMNINLFSFFDDEGRARHPLMISRNNYESVAN